jgi:hypothetical protein
MAWDCQAVITGNATLVLPCSFNSQVLAVEVSSPNKKDTWFRAGYLQSFVTVDGDRYLGRKYTLSFGYQLLEIPYSNYSLEFSQVKYLGTSTINIKGLSTQQILNIMPNYAPMPTAVANQPVLDSLPTSFVAPIYTAVALPATYQCLPANPARQTFAVGNTGTAPIYLDLDAPTAAAKRFITIVVGGVYVCDFDYVGAVFIWSSNTATQTAEIRELIQ